MLCLGYLFFMSIMSSSAAGQPFFDISDEDTLPYLMKKRQSAAECRIKATVRPEMSVLFQKV